MKDKNYRYDLINAAMGARRLTNEDVARLSRLNVNSISKIRNGGEVRVGNLKKVADALGLEMSVLFTTKPDRAA